MRYSEGSGVHPYGTRGGGEEWAGFGIGVSTGTGSLDYLTLAYDAATGATRWHRRYDGPGHSDDDAGSVAVSPNGTSVFVAGQSVRSTSDTDYATVAYVA